MALAIHSAGLCLFAPTGNSNTNLFLFRNCSRIILTQKKCKREISCCSLDPFPQRRIYRRDLALVVLGLSSVSITLPFSATLADEELKMASFVDEINAYSYLFPVELPSKKFLFKWVESRKPERYSSAAPLSPDARLRIVSERVDIIDNLIISVTIGPPNSKIIKSKDKSMWTAKDVADSVLSDKSALRVTSSQRLAESSVLDTRTSEAQESSIYRHYLSSTAERDGYLYSLSASTLSTQWKKMGPFLEKAVNSFRLVSPTEDYVPPYKDPWRFW
ncbi:psbP domain-containing protein 5, chloroplastic isoform X2 [Prosopis cineraria]|uniref:psbP domain-containing protein 5, chloroplastic isoform X2 n=1 Tax=Prosopis cineraria TaxID=364024 RepID=UPI00240ED78F|nr:psbP domain-containing protein 5, chloroplastic isoform X2 [Prosopis cineraria]